MNLTFIGLGIMGSRMVANLLKNDLTITVYNRSQAPVDQLVAQGALAAPSLSAAVAEADLVFSMLSTPEVVAEVFMAEGAALSAMPKGAIWVDCSTVNPSFSLQAQSAAKRKGINFMDAPVAGTTPQAESASLAFFVGGSVTNLDKVRPYLNLMGEKILHLGEVGKGASFKMLVNVMLAQSMLVFSETLLLGEKMGLDRDFLLDTLPQLVVAAPFTKFKAEMIRQQNYEVQFPLEWMHKDLHLATTTAYELNQALHLANQTKEIFAAAKQAGLGRLDFAAIHQFLEKGKR